MHKPELLSPAGTLRNARYAFAYGADAVYAGLPRYSLRVRNNDFLPDKLAQGIAEAHALGKRFYLACNVMPHGGQAEDLPRRHSPGGGAGAGRPDHVRSRSDPAGARALAGSCRSICRCRPTR